MTLVKSFSLDKNDEKSLERLVKKYPGMDFARLINMCIRTQLEFDDRNKFAPPFTESSPESWATWFASCNRAEFDKAKTKIYFIKYIVDTEENKRCLSKNSEH